MSEVKTSMRIDHLKAWSTQGLAALAQVDESGRFLLALPTGGPFRLELSDDASTTPVPFVEPALPVLSGIKVCTPSFVYELGPIHIVPSGCGPVPDPNTGATDCASAHRSLWGCQASVMALCQALEDDLARCQSEASRQCELGPDPTGCIDQLCLPQQDAVAQSCIERCALEQRIIEMCADPACNAPPVAVTESPLPVTLGCEEAVPGGM